MNPCLIPDENNIDSHDYLSAEQVLIRQQSIGLLVRRLRQMNNYTQKDLALLASTDQSYLSDIEHGSSNLSIEKLLQLSDSLEIGGEKLLHMSSQITYSAQLNEARSLCRDEHNTCATGTGHKDSQTAED